MRGFYYTAWNASSKTEKESFIGAENLLEAAGKAFDLVAANGEDWELVEVKDQAFEVEWLGRQGLVGDLPSDTVWPNVDR